MTESQVPQEAGMADMVHYVSHAPFDPFRSEKLTPEQERYYMASQLRMMWWRFRRHKLAVTAGIIILLSYFSILITEFLAPYELHSRYTDFIYAPPQEIHMFHEGNFVGPFVYALDYTLNMDTLKREYVENREKVDSIRFFCSGDKYKFWGPVTTYCFCNSSNKLARKRRIMPAVPDVPITTTGIHKCSRTDSTLSRLQGWFMYSSAISPPMDVPNVTFAK